MLRNPTEVRPTLQYGTYDEPILAGQADYFPNLAPYSLFQFEKTDTTHYITSVQWVSLKWFSILRIIFLIFFIITTPLLILTFLSEQAYFFLAPRFILHIIGLVFYLSTFSQTIIYRTLLKQIHEYTLRLDPIPTPPYLKFVHFLYVIFITFTPTYYIFEFLTLPHFDAQYSILSIVYHSTLLVILLIEINCNAIPILLSHWVYIYLIGIPYLILTTLLYTNDIKIQANWYVLLDKIFKFTTHIPPTTPFSSMIDQTKPSLYNIINSTSEFIQETVPTAEIAFQKTVTKTTGSITSYEGWILTVTLLICALHASTFFFCFFRGLTKCKKQRKKDNHQGAVYFFNTTEYSSRLALPAGVHFHVQSEAVVNNI